MSARTENILSLSVLPTLFLLGVLFFLAKWLHLGSTEVLRSIFIGYFLMAGFWATYKNGQAKREEMRDERRALIETDPLQFP